MGSTGSALGCTCRARCIRNVLNISAQLNFFGIVMDNCSLLTEQVNGATREPCKAEDATPTCIA